MSETHSVDSVAAPGWAFTTTHWSVVLSAGDAQTPNSAAALERLCQTYWPPVYAHVRRAGHDPEAARDLTQEFFLRVIEGQWLSAADPDRGRFRSFLLTCLNRFLVSEWRRGQSKKRGGDREFFSLDEAREEDRFDLEPASGETPDRAFDRRWAETVIARATARLRAEYEAAGQRERFEVLKVYLLGGQESYADAAARLGLSPAAVKSAIFTIRRRFGEVLRAQLAETVTRPEDVEEELNHLLSTFSS